MEIIHEMPRGSYTRFAEDHPLSCHHIARSVKFRETTASGNREPI